MTIASILRGYSDEKIKAIYNTYPYPQIDIYPKVCQICDYKEDNINKFYEEIKVIAERIFSKIPTLGSYSKLYDALICYIYDSYYTPAIPKDWKPNADIITEKYAVVKDGNKTSMLVNMGSKGMITNKRAIGKPVIIQLTDTRISSPTTLKVDDTEYVMKSIEFKVEKPAPTLNEAWDLDHETIVCSE